MTSVPPSRHRVADGFSLLEVVIAAGLLLLTVASVSVAVANVSHAGRRAEAAMRVDASLESELARLASLPFCAVTLPSVPVGDPTAASDLLAAVFPDAGGPRDSADARYVLADEGGVPGGSFVTRFDQDGVSVTCVARFRHHPGGSWLAAADVAGWDLAVSSRPPAPLLVVEVTAAAQGVLRTGRLVREAGADPVPSPRPIVPVGP